MRVVSPRRPKPETKLDPAASLAERAQAAGARFSRQRALVCDVLEQAEAPPDAVTLTRMVREVDPRVSITTVYRAMKVLKDLDLVAYRDFGHGRSRFEIKRDDHDGHLINTETGGVIAFRDPELDALKKRIAERLGYELESHSLELYGRPKAR